MTRHAERWIAWVRLAAVCVPPIQLTLFTESFPEGYERYETYAWITTGVFAAGAILLFGASRIETSMPVGLAALVFDTGIALAYAAIFAFDWGAPSWWILLLPVLEAALRFGLVGGILLPIALLPCYAFLEWWRTDRFRGPDFSWDRVAYIFVLSLVAGVIVGWLVRRLSEQTGIAETRAEEAERFRDRLGRRVDVLEAANRCARALGSSLDLDEAFGAFFRELQGLIPFERTGIVLAEDGSARVIAVAGRGAETTFPRGSERPVTGSALEQVLRGQTLYREDMNEQIYPEEPELTALGLRSRVATPLLIGPRAIGMLSIAREQPSSFTSDEVELASLLGRLVATAVQNIRAYESERATVGELTRLSSLRADFVSLVSHELRSPMAAVLGASQTLLQRWRELAPEQRESFLSLIADETSRLADLVSDVLDTSRIDAGTFPYTFADVDLEELAREVAAAGELAQDEVRVRAVVRGPLPVVHGDRERLRQVLINLVDNAVKSSPAGGEVELKAAAGNGQILVEVTDRGPGIAREDHEVIFEKFGRAQGGLGRPGTGLGLFIARSITEAHGGALVVRSSPEQGATFTVTLPGRGF